MARDEQHREDLLAEATALVERAELRVRDLVEPVVVGFRRDGSASFFFGADLVYQFNTAGQLRRAFADQLLIKAERGRLASLRRERSPGQMNLVRRDLSASETEGFLRAARERLTALASELRAGQFTIERQVPEDADVVARIIAWLEALPNPIAPAASPRVG